MERDDLAIELASPGDAGEIADLYLAARADALPFLRRVHGDEETRQWIAGTLLTTREVWIAKVSGRVVGLLALDGHDLDQLYLLPGWYRRGIGSRLVAKAKERCPDRLTLFTFQRNARARSFYDAHGFRIVEMSDGTGNEEQEPDILYEWLAEKFARCLETDISRIHTCITAMSRAFQSPPAPQKTAMGRTLTPDVRAPFRTWPLVLPGPVADIRCGSFRFDRLRDAATITGNSSPARRGAGVRCRPLDP